MKIRDVTSQFPLFLPPPNSPRSSGVHVSSIIRCIATEAGILKPQWSEELSLCDVREITNPDAILRISIGLAWEEYYIPKILSRYGVCDHPGEMNYQGVYMTHDAEELTVIITLGAPQASLKIHEVKATYKSTKTVGDLTKQWMWLAQMKAYCIAAGSRTAVLHVLFLCGDYTMPIRPRLQVWELEFSEEELADNWTLLDEYKTERLRLERENNDGVYRTGE